MRPVLAAVAPLALAAALGLPARPAAAEGRPGSFTLAPSVKVATDFSDNIFLTDDDEESSFGVSLMPRIELGYRTEVLDVGADVGVDFRRTADYWSQLGDEFYFASGHAQLGLLPGLTVRLANAFAPSPVELGLPEDEVLNLVQSNRTDLDLRYWRSLPGERELAFGLRGTRFASDDYTEEVPGAGGTVILDDDFNADYWEGIGSLEFRQPLGRRTAGYARAQAGYRAIDESSRSDNFDYSLLVGLHSLRFRNAEIDLAGGYGRIHFASLGQQQRIVGRANLRYRLQSGWSWLLGVNHLSSADLVGNAAMETTGRIGIEKRFGDGRTAAGVSVFVTRFDTDTWSDGANLFGGGEVEVRRQLSRRAQVRIAYRHWHNRGGYELDDLIQNRLKLELAIAY